MMIMEIMLRMIMIRILIVWIMIVVIIMLIITMIIGAPWRRRAWRIQGTLGENGKRGRYSIVQYSIVQYSISYSSAKATWGESVKRRLRRFLFGRDAFRRIAGSSRRVLLGPKRRWQQYAGMCRLPCGKPPMKDKRACSILRILTSTLK